MSEDTISRQAAIEIIQSMYPGMPRVPWMLKKWQKQYEPYIRLEEEIKRLPSAEPDRVSPGNIVINEQGWLKYCPVCGSRMRGDADG